MKLFPSPLARTLLLAGVLCCCSGYAAFMIESYAENKVSSCSYLDPVTIDLSAFAIAGFLFFEALAAILRHRDSRVPGQITRCLRMSVASAICVVHILQFIHK